MQKTAGNVIGSAYLSGTGTGAATVISPGTIRTIATGINASNPTAATFDPLGNYYFFDQGSHTIKKLDKDTGVITTVVGGGNVYPFDGQLSSEITLAFTYSPVLAVDSAGDIFFSTSSAYAIVYEVDAISGKVQLYAGGARGVDSGDGGPARAAGISDLAVDVNGDLFVADYRVVRKVDAQTNVISTYAGLDVNAPPGGDGGPASTAVLGSVNALAFDSARNLYLLVAYNGYAIRRIDRATGLIRTIAGDATKSSAPSGDDGLATSALLGYYPSSVRTSIALDAAANVYLNDNSGIRVIESASGIIRHVAGISPVFSTETGDNGQIRLRSVLCSACSSRRPENWVSQPLRAFE